MTSTYPGTIDEAVVTAGNNSTTAPDHADQHTTHSAAINAIEVILGDDTMSDPDALRTKAQSVTTGQTIASTQYVDALVVGVLNDRGNWDASGNVYPSTGGSGASGAILKGNLWFISVAGTLGGVLVQIGDTVRALVDTPGQTSTNWDILQADSTTVRSVTGLNTNNSDPRNPIVQVSTDGVSITGAGTPGDPLVAHLTGGGTLNTQVFTASGTWTKPTGTYTYVQVAIYGSGGGGGAGGADVSGNTRSGGGGGGGGAMMFKIYKISDLPSTVAVTIGAGGAGGLGATLTGGSGGSGSVTSFGSYGSMPGGAGGQGAQDHYATGGGGSSNGVGIAAASVGGISGQGTQMQGANTTGSATGVPAEYGGAAGGSTNTISSSSGDGGSSIFAGPGGGGGGAINASNVAFGGGTGGTTNSYGGAGGGAGGASSSTGAPGSAGSIVFGLGSGGGGGGASTGSNIDGAVGGAGSTSAGGGGGGGSTSTGTSKGGNGGAGGRGEIRVYTW